MTSKREILQRLAIRSGFARVDVPAVRAALAAKGHEVAYSTVNAWFSGGRRPTQASQLALAEVLGASNDEAVELFKAPADE